MAVVSMKQLLEAGVHFGHQTRRWNPKMNERSDFLTGRPLESISTPMTLKCPVFRDDFAGRRSSRPVLTNASIDDMIVCRLSPVRVAIAFMEISAAFPE